MNSRSSSIRRLLALFGISAGLVLTLAMLSLAILEWRLASDRKELELASGSRFAQALLQERLTSAHLLAEQAAQMPQPAAWAPAQATFLTLSPGGELVTSSTGRSIPRFASLDALPAPPFSGFEIDDQGTPVAVAAVASRTGLVVAIVPFTTQDVQGLKGATGLDCALYAGQTCFATTLYDANGQPATSVPLVTPLASLPRPACPPRWVDDPALPGWPYLSIEGALYGVDGTPVGAYTVSCLDADLWSWALPRLAPWLAVTVAAAGLLALLLALFARRVRRPLHALRRDLMTLASRPGAAPPPAAYGLAEVDALVQPVAQLHAARTALAHNNERLNERLVRIQTLAVLGQLAAGVAHDLNNPITTIMGLADIILSADPDPDTQRDVEVIRRQAERSGSIVRSLLSFARRQRDELQWVGLNELISQTIELLAYQARVSGVSCEVSLAGDLPPVWADASQMQQVFFNLIINALQAMGSAHQRGSLLIATSWVPPCPDAPRGWVTIRVVDDGPGIAEEVLPHLFQPYFTTRAASGGTGLGLSIASDIVDRHGGRIWAENNEDAGACFSVQLPVAPDPPPRGLTAGPYRILLADADAKRAALLTRLLRRQGYMLSAADDGRTARDKLELEPCDLVICALELPHLDGRELYHWTRMHRPELAGRFVFVISGELSDEVDAFLKVARAWVLMPPFQDSAIRNVIGQALR